MNYVISNGIHLYILAFFRRKAILGLMAIKNTPKHKNVRLSKDIIPLEYDIELHPDLENFTFLGNETITLSILKSTKKIVLHSKEIEVVTVHILIKKEKMFASKILYDEKTQTVAFNFPKNIARGKYKLVLVFKGILNDKMRGFYRSKYHVDGREHHLATTQFEATDARRAFPCCDEPAHKAVFHVSLVVQSGKTAISNTLPVSAREHSAGFEIVKFSPTPKMSTYLLAFIVGDLEFIEKKSSRGVLVRVYTTPGKKHQAGFALDVTVRCLEFYEKYFDIPYPLNTLDMIAIPDFSSLAMENWGAITFREIGLLVDEEKTSLGSKELIAEVIAHELAHQWFGNLVTMEWWTHLWLNEGFASYIPYIVVDKLFPKWNIWERFNTQTLGVALKLDALNTTHPIEIEVHHPDEIGEIFDAVSYSKGASIIRMLAEYLGEKDFRDGLRYYLKKHSYKNTETIHLWQAFEKISHKPVAKMMHGWTSKPGYPVVNVSSNSNQLAFSQERFFSSSVSKKKAQDKTIWQIPISLGKQKFLMSTKNLSISAPKNNFKINLGENSFFRTAYDKILLEKLKKQVETKSLSVSDRLGIIRDLFALAEAGIIPTTDALEFITSYKNEDNYVVWVELATGLMHLEQVLAKTAMEENLRKITLDLFSPLAKKLGWEKKQNEPYSYALLRSLALSRAGKSGDKQVIKEAKRRFNLIQKGKHVSPDIRGVVYSIIASMGGEKELNILIKKYEKETLHEEKNRIGGVLGEFKDPKILKKVCIFALSKSVRIQDAISVLSGIGRNPKGRDIWWNFVKANWKLLVARYGEGGMALSGVVKALSGSAEEKHLKDFRKFFKTHDAPGAKRSILQVLEKIESNTAWLKRDYKKIERFFENN